MTTSSDDRYLYVLDSGAAEIQAFSANADGTLALVQTITGLARGEDGPAGL